MRKVLFSLLAVLSLGLGSAFAQDSMYTQWAGVSTGFPIGIVLHYGIEDLLGPDLDLRANLSAVTFLGGTFSVTGGADVLYNLNLDMDLPLNVYAGGGLGVGISIGDTTGIGLGLRGLAGAEYPITDQIGVFGELQVGLGINPVFQPGLALGINYHF